MAKTSTPRVLNINIGVLGHVDSGKTTLGKLVIRLVLNVVAFKVAVAVY